MSHQHTARVVWQLAGRDFLRGRYSREHTWTFDGGQTVPASASPANVALPYSNPAGVDPEEAFVAAIASCHMLTFLYEAYKDGVEVVSYDDEAVGAVTENERGILWVSSVVLRPWVEYPASAAPSLEQQERLHHRAHMECFIANSVKTEITVRLSEVAGDRGGSS